MNNRMKGRIRDEYFRRVKKIVRSNLYAGNVISGINAWAIGVVRYGGGIIDWTKEELQSMDNKTRKILTIKGACHPRGTLDKSI